MYYSSLTGGWRSCFCVEWEARFVSTVCCRKVGKNKHRFRRSAAIHFHLLHTHQGSSAQLVVPARIGVPPSRCYDAARRACCDAATRHNNPKASPSQALPRTTKHSHRPSSSKLHPWSPPPSRDLSSSRPRDILGAKTLPRAPETSSEQRPFQGPLSRGPPEGERRGRSRKSKGRGGLRHFFHRGQLQSNLLTESHRSGKNRMKIEPHTNATIRQPHPARPTKRHSRSTSCGGSVSQPEPRAPGSSNMEEATARAAAHAINEPHRRRHACSTRRPINCVSLHAFAVANGF